MILKDCDRCIIYGPDGDVLTRASVECDEEDVTLYFEDVEELRSVRARLPVDFFDSQTGYVRTFCELNVKKNSPHSGKVEPWMARCQILKVIEAVQRQKDVRVKIKLEMKFMSFKQGHFRGIIQNISAGGIYITTTQPMSRNELFSFSHRFVNKEREVRVMTLWAKKLPGNYYGYGCKFVDLGEGTEMDIRQFVFRQQQLNRIYGPGIR